MFPIFESATVGRSVSGSHRSSHSSCPLESTQGSIGVVNGSLSLKSSLLNGKNRASLDSNPPSLLPIDEDLPLLSPSRPESKERISEKFSPHCDIHHDSNTALVGGNHDSLVLDKVSFDSHRFSDHSMSTPMGSDNYLQSSQEALKAAMQSGNAQNATRKNVAYIALEFSLFK